MRRTTTERGYGTAHQKTRAHYQARINAGETIPCWRCGGPIDKTVPFDLGHLGTQTMGPEHRHKQPAYGCPGNRGEGATRGNRLRASKAPTTPLTW